MQAIRTTISGTAGAGVAVAAALVLASAPAASSPHTSARPLLTGAAALRVPPDRVETASSAWRMSRRDGISTTAQADALGIRVTRPDGTRGGAVRIVIETRDPAQARAAVRAAGGRVERSANGLVQALVSPAASQRLGKSPGVGLVRRPYTHVESALSGEEVTAAL